MNFSDDESFTFLPPDQELKIPPTQLPRAKKAIQNVAANHKEIEPEEIEEERKRRCCECLFTTCCRRKSKKSVEKEEDVLESSTEITPEMQRASSQGWSMVKNIVFPALPGLLQDLWVFLELAISIVAFILALIDFARGDRQISESLQTALSCVATILALIDAYIYFVQQGSFATGVKACWKKLKKRQQRHEVLQEEVGEIGKDIIELQDELKEEIEGEDGEKKCCRFSKKWRECFDSWFELARTILSELLLYPLIMFDMFCFITGATYDVRGNERDFSLFVVGGFYLILGVYIMRVFIVAGSMISLIRIPKNKEATSGSSGDNFILIRFCVHTLGQIAVHLLVILVVAAKINNEHVAIQTLNNMTDTNSTLRLPDDASPFLITAIILGWVVPIVGALMFFVVNYYWMKEFSIGFWLNMISLLQGESFAETMFGGKGLSMTKEKALDFIEKSQYKKVKKQLKRFKVPSFWKKFFFPLRVPLTAFCGLLYDVSLLSLISCLMLTSDPVEGTVKLVVFKGDDIMTTVFVISVIAIIIANIHVLILLNVVLLVVILILAITVAIAVFVSPLILCVYFPSIALTGYYMLCIDPSKISLKSARHIHKTEEVEGEVINNLAYEMNELVNGNKIETLKTDGTEQCLADSSIA